MFPVFFVQEMELDFSVVLEGHDCFGIASVLIWSLQAVTPALFLHEVGAKNATAPVIFERHTPYCSASLAPAQACLFITTER